MDEHTLQVLEYDRFLALLAAFAASEPGQARIRASRPQPDAAAAEASRGLYRECLELRGRGGMLPRLAFAAPDEVLRRAAPEDTVLAAEDLVALRGLLRGAGALRRFLLSQSCAGLVELRALGGEVAECRELAQALERTFDDEGAIVDRASPALAEIRRRLGTLEHRIRSRLDQMLHDPGLDDVLQDRFVALRNNRYVVPVRREMRGRLRGIVHDQSNSGHTLFIEPELTLEEGNELTASRLEERDEIRRILAALSAQVRSVSADLARTAELLTRCDVAWAVSAWAEQNGCHFPAFGPALRLARARHPLLLEQFRREDRLGELVPLDLAVAPDCRVVVISGSNTGGKTVILKTIGLLTLLAQTGLPIPAHENTVIAFFPAVLADIGDEQSLAEHLSTFGGHLRQLVGVLKAGAGERALVLLDELGAGTDPVEGGALGCALLETLSRSAGLTLATTHLGMLKAYAQQHERMENASVRFNAETLKPEFVLELGRPGASHALTIAARAGIPADVLDLARQLMDRDHTRLEDLLANLDENQRRAAADLATAREARDQAVAEHTALERELTELRKERRRLLHQAQEEAAALVSNTRRELERLLTRAKQAPPPEEARELRERLAVREQRVARGLEETRSRPAQPVAAASLKPGDRVWVEVLQDDGVVTDLASDGKRATVEVGGLSFEVATQELGAPHGPASAPDPARAEIGKHLGTRRVSTELNLIGQRVEPALVQLERFIDDALLAGLVEVRVVHGHGTGALRQAVHEYLERAPITGYRLGVPGKDPGGSGATVIEI